MLKNSEEIATVPEAPPSTLSKKFIELLKIMIKSMVMPKSITLDPVGDPTVLV